MTGLGLLGEACLYFSTVQPSRSMRMKPLRGPASRALAVMAGQRPTQGDNRSTTWRYRVALSALAAKPAVSSLPVSAQAVAIARSCEKARPFWAVSRHGRVLAKAH